MVVQGLIALDSAALEVADLLKLCLKIFWSASYMEVPAVLLQPDTFAAWMTALHTLVLRPVPTVCPPLPSSLTCMSRTSCSTEVLSPHNDRNV